MLDFKLSQEMNVVKSFRVTSRFNVELETNVSEIFSVSIIKFHVIPSLMMENND
jgi:hypothetical protein